LIGLFVLSWLLALAFCLLSYGQNGSNDNDPHAGGYIPPTPEQERYLEQTHPRTVKVWPNRLAWVRINEERKAKGLPPLPEKGFVRNGAEKESTVGNRSVISGVPKGFVGLTATASSCDNSLADAFPEIRTQGSIGSCTNFAIAYYQLTYTVGRLYGWNNKNINNDKKFSPKWTYNMINGGVDGGSWPGDAYAVLEKHGAARWSLFPYQTSGADPKSYREWCRDGETWRDAIGYRTKPFGFLPPPATTTGDDFNTWLASIKGLLANGEVLTFATYISGWQFTTVQDNKSTPDDNAFVRKPVAYWVNGSPTPANHMMTIVGYNDRIWTDINKNRKVDTGETGALKIANSWGPGWMDSGFCWLAYDALRSVSAVAGGPGSGRQCAIAGRVFSIELKYNPYTQPPELPVLFAQFKLNHAERDQLRITLGVYNDGALISSWIPGALQCQGGPYAFDGSTVACDGTFVFDFTDVLQSAGKGVPYGLEIREGLADGYPAEFLGYKLSDTTGHMSGGLLSSPATFDNDTMTVGLAYPSALESTPVAVASASPTSGRAPLKVTFDGSRSQDSGGDISSYVWDFGDGSSPVRVQPLLTTTHTYSAAGTYTATLTVADRGWSESSTQVPVTVTRKK
jgi:C1A family cysteine protease